MRGRTVSVAWIVSVVLVAVLTSWLGGMGAFFYVTERRQQLDGVRQDADLAADQLSSGLAYAMWNFDYAQVDRIVESTMKDRSIFAIVVRPVDPTRSSPVTRRAHVRDAQWGVASTESEIDDRGLVTAERDVSLSGHTIGTVRVAAVSTFAEQALHRKARLMLGSIVLLGAALIGVLYVLLWRTVIRPLRAVEEYAGRVSSDVHDPVRLSETRFQGELQSLSRSIEAMVGLLRARLADLEASQTAPRLTRFAVERSSDAMYLIRPDGTFADVNDAACRVLGYAREELLQLGVAAIDRRHGSTGWPARWDELRRAGSLVFETAHTTKDGREIPVEVSANHVAYEQREYDCAMVRDISARQRAAQEKDRLEAQLRQAQKMESVGRLAGGVAHDFNNMLCAILGQASLFLEDIPPSHPFFAGLLEIQRAAERSADLTRQLLAFARKQTVTLRVIDLNETLRGMLKMLQRLIGENIRLHFQPAPDLWPVHMDPSQVDQILANLCINARDAIAGVGDIAIETSNAVLDAEYCERQPEAKPGEYVRLVVSDTGCGMDQATLAHVFEPFFTTKELGKGTGLGLATVYGVVHQNAGSIDIRSEPGSGATFTIYLPRCQGKGEAGGPESGRQTLPRGHETVLLVEDEPAILGTAATMLRKLGYSVLEAETPSAAIRTMREHGGEIHLLLTDVVMPEMTGKDLAELALARLPRLRVLYMSGYADTPMGGHGLLGPGARLLHKPFTAWTLAVRVREALGDPGPAPGPSPERGPVPPR